MRLTKRPLAIGAGLAAGLAPLAYPLLLRRWCLTWGARADEAPMNLPGDELLPGAGLVTTRAITIDAPPDAIGRLPAVAERRRWRGPAGWRTAAPGRRPSRRPG
jgi:hypothetical protein